MFINPLEFRECSLISSKQLKKLNYNKDLKQNEYLILNQRKTK